MEIREVCRQYRLYSIRIFHYQVWDPTFDAADKLFFGILRVERIHLFGIAFEAENSVVVRSDEGNRCFVRDVPDVPVVEEFGDIVERESDNQN